MWSQALGPIERDVEIVVLEGLVLLGVEHLEHGRGRVAAMVHTHLVDFIQQEQRVANPRLGHLLQQLTGH